MADKIKTLSAAIRYGSTFIGETNLFVEQHNSDRYNCGCALGTAYLAVIDADPQCMVVSHVIFPALVERFNVPYEIIRRVSMMHYSGEKTRAQCADWLEARGY